MLGASNSSLTSPGRDDQRFSACTTPKTSPLAVLPVGLIYVLRGVAFTSGMEIYMEICSGIPSNARSLLRCCIGWRVPRKKVPSALQGRWAGCLGMGAREVHELFPEIE